MNARTSECERNGGCTSSSSSSIGSGYNNGGSDGGRSSNDNGSSSSSSTMYIIKISRINSNINSTRKPRVLQETVPITRRYHTRGCTGTVFTDSGTVCENPTRGIPVTNPRWRWELNQQQFEQRLWQQELPTHYWGGLQGVLPLHHLAPGISIAE